MIAAPDLLVCKRGVAPPAPLLPLALAFVPPLPCLLAREFPAVPIIPEADTLALGLGGLLVGGGVLAGRRLWARRARS